jgi:monoterpene epsilon-lactone hydrolase
MFNLMFSLKRVEVKYWIGYDEAKAGCSLNAKAFEELMRSNRIAPQAYSTEIFRKSMEGFQIFSNMPTTTRIDHVSIRREQTFSVEAYWIIPIEYDPKDEQSIVLLYAHGGGYISGTLAGYKGLCSEMARKVRGRTLFIDYRFAPEFPFPSQTEEMVAAYRWLNEKEGIDPSRIVILGDSAGGGLTLLATMALLDKNLAPPRAIATWSAWTEIDSVPGGVPSYSYNKEKDVMIPLDITNAVAADATNTMRDDYEARKHPKFSPLYADLKPYAERFPPLLMQAGGSEVFVEDSILFTKKAKEVGINVTLEVFPHMQHIWMLWFEYFEEGDKALQSTANFIKFAHKA